MNNIIYNTILMFMLVSKIIFDQKDSSHSFFSKIYFPVDLGFAISSDNSLKNSMITKMGLEFRIKKTMVDL